jgi:hypothetical protein
VLALAAGGAIGRLVVRPRGVFECAVTLALIVPYQGYRIAREAEARNPLLREAGLKLAEVSRVDDFVVVLSHDLAFADGAPNNFQEPDVFFHAKRWGRSLARDRQTVAGLSEAFACGARWFVNFPSLNQKADDSFRNEMARRMTRVAAGPGFEIRELIDPWNGRPRVQAR